MSTHNTFLWQNKKKIFFARKGALSDSMKNITIFLKIHQPWGGGVTSYIWHSTDVHAE